MTQDNLIARLRDVVTAELADKITSVLTEIEGHTPPETEQDWTCVGAGQVIAALCQLLSADLIERLSPPLDGEGVIQENERLAKALFDCASALAVFINHMGPRRKDGSHRCGLIVSRDAAQAMMLANNEARDALEARAATISTPREDPVRQVAMELREALREIVEKAKIGEISYPRLEHARSAIAAADAVMGRVEVKHDTL